MAKLALDTDYKGKADQLWDGTTKFAQDNKLTVTDVVNKLSYQQPLDYGNLKVGATQTSLLGALGLAPKIDMRIRKELHLDWYTRHRETEVNTILPVQYLWRLESSLIAKQL
ncbi:MAG: hypothetical protein CM15mV78_440 [uncultured marine virus]|nr:MAG: hypothetical protein CM15mV78_440 [uncultured marine virus]